MTKATKIRWNKDETAHVIDMAATYRVDSLVSEIEAIRMAQEILPPDRRRSLPHLSFLSDSFLNEFRDKVEFLRTEAKKPPPVQEAPPEEPKPPTLDAVVEVLANQIGNAIGNAVADHIQRSIRESLQNFGIEEPRAEVSSKPEEVRRKPKLLVVGPLPAQADILKSKFVDKLDLRFVSSQEGTKVMSSRINGVDKVVLMTGFISHAHQQSAMQLKGRDNVVLVDGGMTSLAKRLSEM